MISSTPVFLKRVETFLDEAHQSRIAHGVVESLLDAANMARYEALTDRNTLVRTLASDVEGRVGVSGRLMFASEGHLHDQLQELLDAYLDMVDDAEESLP